MYNYMLINLSIQRIRMRVAMEMLPLYPWVVLSPLVLVVGGCARFRSSCPGPDPSGCIIPAVERTASPSEADGSGKQRVNREPSRQEGGFGEGGGRSFYTASQIINLW